MICRYHNVDCNNANENGYCKTSACVNPKFVVNIYPTDMEHYVGDKSKAFHFEESRWHTGTPTEDGYYLCHIQFSTEEYESDEEGYDLPYWFKNGSWEGQNEDVKIIAWQKIEPYKERRC